MMRSWALPRAAQVLAVLGAGLWTVSAQAQGAEVTASKTLGISAFGGFSRVSPDYGQYTNYGFVAGADLTHHLRLFDPSLEVRFGYASGKAVSENTLAVGLKAEKQFGRAHPYADLMLGHGNINFQNPIVYPNGPYAHDDSIIYALGVGLDYDLTPRYAVKLDFQEQSWKLGAANNRLTPTALSVGVVYRFAFDRIKRRR